MNEINLVGVGPKKYDEKKLRAVRIIAVISLFLTGALSVGFFLLNTKFSVAEIKSQQTQVISQISSYNERFAKISIVNGRINEIRQIREQNTDHTQFIETTLSMVPQGVSVNNFEIEEKDVSLSIVSTSLLPMSDFINELLDFSESNSKENPTVSKVTIESLSANDKTGDFFMTIKMEMP